MIFPMEEEESSDPMVKAGSLAGGGGTPGKVSKALGGAGVGVGWLAAAGAGACFATAAPQKAQVRASSGICF
jgi:hypothetical protein